MKPLKLLFIAGIAVLTVCCKNQGTQTETKADAKNETENVVLKPGKQKYELKSGIVEYDAKTMGTNMKQVLYFDDYGAKEATEIEFEMAGMKSNSRTLNIDGYTYSLDLLNKTGTKHKTAMVPGSDIDFKNISEEMARQMNLKKTGSEVYEGKTCDKYTIDFKEFEMKGTFLVWKGIPLKSEMDLSTLKTVMIAKNFQENVSIPADKFKVPDGFTITEQ